MRFVKGERHTLPVVHVCLVVPPLVAEVPLVEGGGRNVCPATLAARFEAVVGVSKGWDPAVTSEKSGNMWRRLLPVESWVTSFAEVCESDFCGRVGKAWLELAAILTTYLESPVDQVLGPALAGVRARLEPAFWTARCPERKMEVWLLASFLQRCEPLCPQPTKHAFVNYVWYLIVHELGFVPGVELECSRDEPLNFKTYRSRLSGGKGWRRKNEHCPANRLKRLVAVSAAEFAREYGQISSRSTFEAPLAAYAAHKLRQPAPTDAPNATVWTGEFDHLRATEALFSLLTAEQRQKMRRLAEGDLVGDDSEKQQNHPAQGHQTNPFCCELTVCHIDFLELAAALCQFVRYPFGRLGTWAKPLLHHVRHSPYARTLIDVWTTACLLQYSGIESEILHRFCEHTLNFHPRKTIYQFDCYRVCESAVSRSVKNPSTGYDMRQRLQNVNPSCRLVSLDKFLSKNAPKGFEWGTDLAQSLNQDTPKEMETDQAQASCDQVSRHNVSRMTVIRHLEERCTVEDASVPLLLYLLKVRDGDGFVLTDENVGNLQRWLDADEGKAMDVDEGKAMDADEGKAMDVDEGKAMDVDESKIEGGITMYHLATVPGARRGSQRAQCRVMTQLLELFRVPPASLAEFMLRTWYWASIVEAWAQVDPRLLVEPMPAHMASAVSKEQQKEILVDVLTRFASRTVNREEQRAARVFGHDL
ncbi:hypothetical protein GNI_109580 [Gregarina niphandrodes]|uniref:Uncharacterized protein n=1 Tax=Gregarina niphandrodes TaxID=110365 RepID=A0A023B3P5_GRENI|nr:hypothetical protein GNI_109580 [Gregarina niphandrodes]EZG55698.1 hypothetical protein GNI_109580 [Gregarina niphandrodes]|eukprot:XP_011131460.1 hypothetical protein GNI_109580 [Gregarina niphandrodes]